MAKRDVELKPAATSAAPIKRAAPVLSVARPAPNLMPVEVRSALMAGKPLGALKSSVALQLGESLEELRQITSQLRVARDDSLAPKLSDTELDQCLAHVARLEARMISAQSRRVGAEAELKQLESPAVVNAFAERDQRAANAQVALWDSLDQFEGAVSVLMRTIGPLASDRVHGDALGRGILERTLQYVRGQNLLLQPMEAISPAVQHRATEPLSVIFGKPTTPPPAAA